MKINFENIHNQIYNLILDPKITESERNILLHFKNLFSEKNDEKRFLMELAESLRQLSVENIQHQKTLSPPVAALYKEISSVGFFEENLGRGLIAASGLWLK
ncbi:MULTISPECIES: bacteriocin immunity protein [unclassified Streptococcus]|uniref:bacteriocin immunity protein n=1 Tax=unclassified Streptococcus TaxID=2608887 RepID=UPI0018A8C880|nr:MULTISPECIES: bacteriocin immunity protein [unclassified Streptococcus]MBF8970697.1 bacteriocin immunity protein [Streptococcus sp. NLN76]MBG9367031.1 bacteriocin immunity protein [Streptococcus sp. NLN64]MBJ6745471.1 bacteriocin immunity protein [Streptococcus sp. 121]